jgi:hypothetical protein
VSFNFKNQLKTGDMAEAFFYQAHEGTLTKLDGRKSDFMIRETGEHIELKADMWRIEATPNLFMERYSNAETQSPGGPWRALSDGVKYFAYFYVPSLTYYMFETAPLVARLDTLIHAITPFNVRNESWVTLGYKVPRAAVCDLASETKLKIVKVANGKD